MTHYPNDEDAIAENKALMAEEYDERFRLADVGYYDDVADELEDDDEVDPYG